MAQEDLDAAEAGLLSAIKSGDARAVELFNGELARLQSGTPVAGSDSTAKAPAGAPATELNPARKWAAVAGMAPAKALAGVADLGYLGFRKLGEVTGLVDPKSPREPGFSGPVDDLTNYLAGGDVGKLADYPGTAKVPESVGRAALEAAITAPLSGAKTLVGAAKAIGSAAAAGGATQAALEKGMSPWAAIPLGMATGHVTGGVMSKIPGVNGLTPAETLAHGQLKPATEGTSQQAFREGTDNQMLAHGHDIPLLPSQALNQSAPEMEALQEALLSSRSSGGTKLREMASTQGTRVNQLVEGLRNIGGRSPRTDDLLAEEVKKLAQKEVKSRSEAVNDATRSLYQDPLGSAWKFSPQLEHTVDAGLTTALEQYRSEPVVAAAIQHARTNLTGLLSNPEVTPVEVSNMIGHLKRNVLPDISQTSTSDLNRARTVVVQLLAPLENLATRHAPALGQGQTLQASLRADLPGKFDEITRTAAAGGGPRGMLNTASQRPELVSAVANQNPRLAQELLQRTVDNAVTKALEPGIRSGVQAPNAGLTAKHMLADSLEGAALQKNLELLFHGHADPKAAAEGFNRVLDVVAHASKPTGGRGIGAIEPPFISEAVRGGVGSAPQKINVFGRMFQSLYGQFRDNASVHVLTQPDVMDRLAYIARQPKVRLTPALIAATLPQLFQEPTDVP